MVWDGSGAEAYPADVLVEGTRIRTVARTPGRLAGRRRPGDRLPRPTDARWSKSNT